MGYDKDGNEIIRHIIKAKNKPTTHKEAEYWAKLKSDRFSKKQDYINRERNHGQKTRNEYLEKMRIEREASLQSSSNLNETDFRRGIDTISTFTKQNHMVRE